MSTPASRRRPLFQPRPSSVRQGQVPDGVSTSILLTPSKGSVQSSIMGGSMPSTPVQGPFSVSPQTSPILPCPSPPTNQGAAGSEMLDQAKALRMEAETLYRKRDVNAELLEKELLLARKTARDDALKAERRVKEVQKEVEQLKYDLCLAAQRAQREGAVAREWEHAWSKESAEKDLLKASLLKVEGELAAATQGRLQEQEAWTREQAASQAAQHRLQGRVGALEASYTEALHLQHLAAAQAQAQASELNHLRSEVPRLETLLSSATQDLNAHRERGQRLERLLAEASLQAQTLANKVEEGDQRREEEVKLAEAKMHEVAEINAQLCGHRNAKQKIQYLLKVKEEKERLEQDKLRLETLLHSLLQQPPDSSSSSAHPAALSPEHIPKPSAAAANITPKDIFKRGGAKAWRPVSASKVQSKVHLTQPMSPRLHTANRRGSSQSVGGGGREGQGEGRVQGEAVQAQAWSRSQPTRPSQAARLKSQAAARALKAQASGKAEAGSSVSERVQAQASVEPQTQTQTQLSAA